MSERRNSVVGILFGAGAGMAYGISSVLIKQGMGGLAAPLVGAALSMVAGSTGLFILGGNGLRAGLQEGKKSITLLLLSGVASAGGIISSFFALSVSPVTVVSPIQNTNPLFALLWSFLFLGKLERITPRLVLGSLLVVAGVIIITLGRP